MLQITDVGFRRKMLEFLPPKMDGSDDLNQQKQSKTLIYELCMINDNGRLTILVQYG